MEELFRHIINLRALDAVDYIRYGCIRHRNHISDFFYGIKWFIQRGKRGYADCDTWNFDSYLAKVISGGCKKLQEGMPSCPTRIGNQYPNARWTIAAEHWHGILNKISRAFTLLNLWENECRFPSVQERRDIAKGWFFFKKYFADLWD